MVTGASFVTIGSMEKNNSRDSLVSSPSVFMTLTLKCYEDVFCDHLKVYVCAEEGWICVIRVTPVSHTLNNLLVAHFPPLCCTLYLFPPSLLIFLCSHILLFFSPFSIPCLNSSFLQLFSLYLPIILFLKSLLVWFLSLCPTWLNYTKSYSSRWCCVCIEPRLLATSSPSTSPS